MATLRFSRIKVTVKDAGVASQPWGRGDFVHKYRVTVTHRGARYSSDAYGSVADYELGRRTPAEMAATVLDELLSAAGDGDEFVSMTVQGARGLEQLRRLESARKTVRAAKRMGYADLESAVAEARERGLL